MSRIRVILAALMMALAFIGVVTPAAPAADPPGYATVMFGRANWQATYGANAVCLLPPDDKAVTLEEAVRELSQLGVKSTGGVVTERTLETERLCMGYTTQPSWADYARLRDRYGFTVHSQGARYADMTKMTTDAQRRAESIDTLPEFYSRGHMDAWGAFNYGNNKQDAEARQVVNQKFAFGRLYDGKNFSTRSQASTSPYVMRTLSVNGGRCANTSQSCNRLDVNNDRMYASPHMIAARLSPGANQWGVVQFYRFVRGKFGTLDGRSRFAWDCTSPNWRDHWTRQPELYCFDDALTAVRLRDPDAVIASPADVARAWGVDPAQR